MPVSNSLVTKLEVFREQLLCTEGLCEAWTQAFPSGLEVLGGGA